MLTWRYRFISDIYSVWNLSDVSPRHNKSAPVFSSMRAGCSDQCLEYSGKHPCGASLHYIDSGVGTGDLIARRLVPIEPIDTGSHTWDCGSRRSSMMRPSFAPRGRRHVFTPVPRHPQDTGLPRGTLNQCRSFPSSAGRLA